MIRRERSVGIRHIPIVLALLICCTSQAADVAIQPLQRHTNEFSGREVTRNYRVESDELFVGRVVWNLTAKRRTLARGEQELRADRRTDVSIKLELDALRDEVILPAKLTATVVVDNREVAREETSLRFFAEDPFARRANWLRSLDLTLFDPSGITAKRLSMAGIAFRETRNLKAIRKLDRGTLVIGAGVSLADHRGLASAAAAAAAQGTRVLWLNAAEGVFPAEAFESSNHFALAGAAIIQQFDKRLDSIEWGGRELAGSRLRFGTVGKQASLEIGERGWSWADASWPESGGRFIYCGFPIIKEWDTSPTPRYMLLRTLERLTAEELSQ